MTKPTRMTLICRSIAACLALAGCDEATEPEDETREDTIVTIKPDGTYEVRTQPTTRAQVQQEIARRNLLAAHRGEGRPGEAFHSLATDPGCADASMWMFDKENLDGRRICFYRQGPASFGWVDFNPYVRGSIGRYTGFWGGAVRSAYAGAEGGYFRDNGQPEPQLQSFTPYQQFTTAPAGIASATILFLQNGSFFQNARFSMDYDGTKQPSCTWLTGYGFFESFDGVETTFFDTHVVFDDLGPNGNGGEKCRMSYELGNMAPGQRYEITMGGGGSFSPRTCVIWTLEGAFVTAHYGFGVLVPPPISLNTCFTLGF
jgi:hypothetical protein